MPVPERPHTLSPPQFVTQRDRDRITERPHSQGVRILKLLGHVLNIRYVECLCIQTYIMRGVPREGVGDIKDRI